MSQKRPESLQETKAGVRLKDPDSGGVVELRLTLDPEREVVLYAEYRIIDMPGEATISKEVSRLVKGKTILSCLALTGDDLTGDGLRDGKGGEAPLSLTALKLALSEYVMRRYATDEGIVKNRGEFIEEFLKGHPMYDAFADVEFD